MLDMAQLLENPAVIWFLIGLGLFMAEMIMPGLIVAFFGMGAWITALAYLAFDLPLNGQLLVFLVTSVLNLLLLRRTLKNRWWQEKEPESELNDEFLGHTCTVTLDILPGPVGGKVSFKGTTWKAVANVAIPAGQTVRIISKDSIVLFVEPIS